MVSAVGASFTSVILTVKVSLDSFPASSTKSKATVNSVASVSKSCASLRVNTPSVSVNKAESSPVPNVTVAVSLLTIVPTVVLFSATSNDLVVSEAPRVSTAMSRALAVTTGLPARSLKLLADRAMVAVTSESGVGVNEAVAILSTNAKSLNVPPVTVKSFNAISAFGTSEKVIVTNVDSPALRLLSAEVIITVGALVSTFNSTEPVTPKLPIVSAYDSALTDTVAATSESASGVNVTVRVVPVPAKPDNVPPVATKSSITIVSSGSSLNVKVTVAVSAAFTTVSSIVTDTVGEVVSTVSVALSVVTALLLPARSVIKLLTV